MTKRIFNDHGHGFISIQEYKELEEKLKTWKELYDDQFDYNTKLNEQNERMVKLLNLSDKDCLTEVHP
jgi:phage regulator Rha-like protein